MDYKGRIEKLTTHINLIGLQAYICADRSNLFYFTGLPCSGYLVIKRSGETVFYTSPLDYVLADSEAPAGVTVVKLKMGASSEAILADILNNVQGIVGVDQLGLETFRRVSSLVGGVELRQNPKAVWDMRATKDQQEISLIKEACSIADKAMRSGADLLTPGIMESEIKAELMAEIYRRVGDEAAFPPIVASAERSALPHGPLLRGAARDRVIKRGDIVVIDLGVRVEGYCSDLTRTFFIGKDPDQKVKDAIEAVLYAKSRAQGMMRPGVSCSYVDEAARETLASAGLDAHFVHSLGHGVGIDIHEPPRIGPGSQDAFSEGNVVTCEPGIYFAGEWGIRFEDTVLITEDSVASLTSYPLDEYLIH
jgi:Xaa-Pro aminopeptidase